MKIILLSGPPNCGKTTAINLVYRNLTKGLPNPPAKQSIRNYKKDFECIVAFKKKQVALYSFGDVLFDTYNAIIKYCGMGADVLVAAHNNNGSRRQQLAKIVQNSSLNYLINKKIAKSKNAEAQCNTNDCSAIIGKI
jgi:tRNA uridine 5-carbamoylmethylation protein Kti12